MVHPDLAARVAGQGHVIRTQPVPANPALEVVGILGAGFGKLNPEAAKRVADAIWPDSIQGRQ